MLSYALEYRFYKFKFTNLDCKFYHKVPRNMSTVIKKLLQLIIHMHVFREPFFDRISYLNNYTFICLLHYVMLIFNRMYITLHNIRSIAIFIEVMIVTKLRFNSPFLPNYSS